MGTKIRNVALLMPAHASVCSATPGAITEGALSYAHKHEHIRLHRVNYSDLAKPLPLSAKMKFDGIVTFISPPSKAWINQLQKAGCPVVSTSADPLPRSIARVHADATHAMDRILLHFRESGLRDVGVILQQDVEIAQNRADTFVAVAKSMGFNVHRFEARRTPLTHDGSGVETELSDAEPTLIKFVSELPKPAGVVSFYDILGVHLVQVARQLNFSVPEDIAVISAVDTVYCRMCRPEVSAMRTPFESIGYKALELLDRLMAGEPPPARAITLPVTELIVRESSRLSTESMDLERARQFIINNACRRLTVEELMEQLPISRPTFEKRFKARFGITPGQQIMLCRLAHVKTLLETTNLAVSQIAMRCGFSDANKLNLFFKRETGHTPSHYRKTQSSNSSKHRPPERKHR